MDAISMRIFRFTTQKRWTGAVVLIAAYDEKDAKYIANNMPDADDIDTYYGGLRLVGEVKGLASADNKRGVIFEYYHD